MSNDDIYTIEQVERMEAEEAAAIVKRGIRSGQEFRCVRKVAGFRANEIATMFDVAAPSATRPTNTPTRAHGSVRLNGRGDRPGLRDPRNDRIMRLLKRDGRYGFMVTPVCRHWNRRPDNKNCRLIVSRELPSLPSAALRRSAEGRIARPTHCALR
jgi:hypothetical protein